MRRAAPILLALTAAVAAALVANLVLLRYATSSNDPVGKLSPSATVISTPQTTTQVSTRTERTTTEMRTDTTRTTAGTTTDDHGGDDGNSGHGGGDDD